MIQRMECSLIHGEYDVTHAIENNLLIKYQKLPLPINQPWTQIISFLVIQPV
jgi:hypothetical protein